MSAAQEEFEELMRDKNRTSRHPEDNSDQQSFLNISDDDDDTMKPSSSRAIHDDESRPSMSSVRSTIPNKRYGANTGPKGVISDAQDFRDSRRSARMSARSSMESSRTQEPMRSQRVSPTLDAVEDEDEIEEMDDDFMQRWRQNRLQEMQQGPQSGANTKRNGRLNRRLYGGLATVDGDGYLDAVDNSDPESVVVVYIYDDFSQVSDLFEDCLRTLASKHQDTRFVKLHFEDAHMEPAGVPAILAYRNGEKFAGLIPVLDELPDDADLNALTLENVMKRHQILL